jgi:CheY-like chemotaxis protein
MRRRAGFRTITFKVKNILAFLNIQFVQKCVCNLDYFIGLVFDEYYERNVKFRYDLTLSCKTKPSVIAISSMKKKILIIDDEVDFCLIMKGYFGRKNHEGFVAYTLQSGLFLLDEEKPDILFLDNNLPDGQGWKYVDQIVEKNPHLEIYLISAHQSKSSFTSPNKNINVWEKPISLQILNTSFQ